MTNLASNLADTVRAHADRVAVRVDDATTTYAELDEASARVAGMLRQRASSPATGSGSCNPTSPSSPSPTMACSARAVWSSR
ncbi:MAG TPA: hypothetical protein VKG80_18380 [Trebonia sp.]|nr:hypothetical protein [Trebonia sp.]